MEEASMAETMIHLPSELPSGTVAISVKLHIFRNKNQEPRTKNQESR